MRDASTIVTKKLYYDDAYLTEFSAEVVSFSGNDLVLDRTAFFPEEGGQYPDHGVIEGFDVTDVQIIDGEIHHYLHLNGEDARASEQFREGHKVHGAIDAAHRYSNMQMHSGEHLFSGLVHKHLGYDNVGVHLSDREMTMDFEGPIPEDLLLQIEDEANEAVFQNLPIEVVYLNTDEERQSMEYRSKLDLTSKVRVVIIPGYDACACCAPHVRRTSEIGVIKVVGCQSWKGGVRVSLICGNRAGRLLRREHELLKKTAVYLSASVEDVGELTVRLKEENQLLKSRLKEMSGRYLMARADSLPEDEPNAVFFEETAETKAARDVINSQVAKRSGYCAVFWGNETDGWSYIIGSKTRDCREISQKLKELYEARGGGKPEMVQGSVKAKKEELLDFLMKTWYDNKKYADIEREDLFS